MNKPRSKGKNMGQYKIEITAVGGHGCQRELKDGDVVCGCGSMTCPDCLTAKFIADLARAGNNVEAATLTHWPGQPHSVVDTFEKPQVHTLQAVRRRKGSF